jgi:hypothetical protein
MGEQTFVKIRKGITILLAVCFLMSVTTATVSAAPISKATPSSEVTPVNKDVGDKNAKMNPTNSKNVVYGDHIQRGRHHANARLKHNKLGYSFERKKGLFKDNIHRGIHHANKRGLFTPGITKDQSKAYMHRDRYHTNVRTGKSSSPQERNIYYKPK